MTLLILLLLAGANAGILALAFDVHATRREIERLRKATGETTTPTYRPVPDDFNRNR